MAMDMRQRCSYLKIEVTEEQLTAGNYLESRGFRFCAHFGYESAVAMADELFKKECDALMLNRHSAHKWMVQ